MNVPPDKKESTSTGSRLGRIISATSFYITASLWIYLGYSVVQFTQSMRDNHVVFLRDSIWFSMIFSTLPFFLVRKTGIPVFGKVMRLIAPGSTPLGETQYCRYSALVVLMIPICTATLSTLLRYDYTDTSLEYFVQPGMCPESAFWPSVKLGIFSLCLASAIFFPKRIALTLWVATTVSVLEFIAHILIFWLQPGRTETFLDGNVTWQYFLLTESLTLYLLGWQVFTALKLRHAPTVHNPWPVLVGSQAALFLAATITALALFADLRMSTAYVTSTDGLFLRERPWADSDSRKIQLMPYASKVRLHRIRVVEYQQWWRVSFGGREGYAFSHFLSVNQPPPQ